MNNTFFASIRQSLLCCSFYTVANSQSRILRYFGYICQLLSQLRITCILLVHFLQYSLHLFLFLKTLHSSPKSFCLSTSVSLSPSQPHLQAANFSRATATITRGIIRILCLYGRYDLCDKKNNPSVHYSDIWLLYTVSTKKRPPKYNTGQTSVKFLSVP